MTSPSDYRTNRDLFSNHYLDKQLPKTEAWEELDEEELRNAKDDIMELWEREKETAPKRNEAQLEEKFIRPMFRKLGIPFEVEESTDRTQRRPDYGFFDSNEAATEAFTRREEGGDFYKNSVAVADAKQWGRPLDTRGGSEHKRDFENPSYQIHVYLQETPARWAVLTDGKKWRLYYGPTSHRLDSYYEIDLPTVLEDGDLEDFKNFYLFFRHEAFLEDSSGDNFLDDVYDESNVFAQELGEDLQDNIYEAIKVLSEGYLQYPENDLEEEDLDLIHDSSLIYLYRIIFVLYAEAEGRDLLDTDNEIYEQSYSLNSLKQEVAEELDSGDPKYRDWQDDLSSRLDELFKLIDQGSKSRGIPKEDLHIPAYNGGLFRTNPDEDDSPEARFLANNGIGDAYLAQVIELLTRSQKGDEGGKIFVDYSSLDVRHLGSIYEGLLEYKLNIADEPLAVEDEEYVPAEEGDEVVVEEDEVYLTTDSGERKATGSYYTPEYVVEYIVENTLGPLVEDIRMDLMAQREEGFADEFAERVFDLKILDPAMGSGHFLTSAVDYLAREIIDAQERQAAQEGIESVDEEHDINWARRQVAQRCIYGVDLNPLAVELAKVSLWLRTLAAEQPLAFLDHHLKTGNSLVGSDIEEIEELESEGGGDGPNASLADFGVARKGTIEQLMRIYEDFIAIENQELADVKEMEAKYDEFERNKIRQRLEAMTNVHTAEDFGLDNVPSDAYKRMAAALEDDKDWAEIKEMQWFRDAQQWATNTNYFHWRLEYPEVFYEESGSRKENPGFDAVIGNPPWVITSDDALSSYLWEKYQYQSGQPDLYRFFIEQCISLSRSKFSMITPSSWFTIPAAADLREEVIGNQNLLRASLVPQSAFGEVDANMSTFIIDLENVLDEVTILDLSETGEATQLRTVPYDSLVDNDSYRINLQASIKERRIVSQMKADSTPLGNISDRTVGYQLYHTDIHDQEVIDKEAHHSDQKDSESYVPEIRSSSLYKYYVDPESDGYVDLSAEFFRIPPEQFRKGDRILIREVTGDDGITAANVERELLFPKSVISLVVEDNQYSTGYITALLNSNLLSFEFLVTGEKATQDLFPRLSMSSLDRLTIRNPPVGKIMSSEDIASSSLGQGDNIVQMHKESKDSAEFLGKVVEEIKEMKKESHLLNTDISDYLGTYDWGDPLDKISESQPSPGASGTILSESTETKNKLHIDKAEIEEKNGKTIISLVARYKPENPEDFDTDKYDYTRTDPIPALEFIQLDKNKEQLLREFVPYAVSRAGGFANFRDNATTRNSLLDRLSNLTLPEINDVEDGLNQYIEKRKRYDELQEKIENRVSLIDTVVYELYDISDKNVEIVEDAVTND